MVQMSTNRRLPAPTNQGPSAPNFYICTKGLRTFVPRAFGPGYNCTFEIRGILELNQTKSAHTRTDPCRLAAGVSTPCRLNKNSAINQSNKTQQSINEVRALPLESGREYFFVGSATLLGRPCRQDMFLCTGLKGPADNQGHVDMNAPVNNS